MRVPCGVKEEVSRISKDTRILEAFDALLAARMLHVREKVKETPFITEMMEWRPGINGQRDDGLDAAAGALSLQPMHLPHDYFSGRQSWAGGGKQHKAKTEFEV